MQFILTEFGYRNSRYCAGGFWSGTKMLRNDTL